MLATHGGYPQILLVRLCEDAFCSVLVALGREVSEKGERQAIGLHKVIQVCSYTLLLL